MSSTAAVDEVARHVETLNPKRESGVPEFLRRFPTYDGRGTIMAVFDTGVDPTAAGLQRTTTGEAKVVDVIDTTGVGDVDLGPPVKARADGTLAGLTGRVLTLPAAVTNPTGEYRLGFKVARALFGSDVMERIREQRRRTWEREKRELHAGLALRRAADEKAGRRPSRSEPEAEQT